METEKVIHRIKITEMMKNLSKENKKLALEKIDNIKKLTGQEVSLDVIALIILNLN